MDNYPKQYLDGEVSFYGYPIKVDERVLIPRFETEYLVEDVVKFINDYSLPLNIIDIGTGSGCISIALSKLLKNAKITALDISEDAIDLAKKNALLNDVKLNFIQLDILKDKPLEKFNIIISNPPYVSNKDIVDPETKYEPSIALYAEHDGLIFYERILSISHHILIEPFIIAFEIGYNQGERLVNLAHLHYPNAQIILKKDYNQFDRYLYILNKKQ